MGRIRWEIKKNDYGNRIDLHVTVFRTRSKEDMPTERDGLDATINVVAPEIREGILVGEVSS